LERKRGQCSLLAETTLLDAKEGLEMGK